jgi:hypothetical protein
MPRAKSPSGSKSNRKSNGNINTEPVNAINPAASPETPNVAETIPQINALAVEAVAVETLPDEVRPGTNATPEPHKFELRKTEPRKNLFPINLEDEIRRRAYELYQQRVPGTGNEAEDWLNAEREVMQRYRQQTAS